MKGTKGSRDLVVAIDGPAGAGKSSVSRRLAAALGYRYVDTGAMYRIVGVLAVERGVDLADPTGLAALCDAIEMSFADVEGGVCVYADGRDVSAVIRTPEAAQQASKVSAVSAVRERLVAKQRRMGAGGGVVMEGRDIGTAVFPEAPVKIFLDASPEERARRRAQELHGRASDAEVARIAAEIADRDARDRSRAHSPLRPADDAVLVDTTGQTIDAVVEILRDRVMRTARALATQE